MRAKIQELLGGIADGHGNDGWFASFLMRVG
jgi:hypothetical protein